MVLGGVTFCLLMTTAKQFFPPKWQRVAWIVAVVQFAGYAFAVLLADSFAVVVLNYSPIMLLLLTMNIIGLRSGLGSRQMIAGILILVPRVGNSGGRHKHLYTLGPQWTLPRGEYDWRRLYVPWRNAANHEIGQAGDSRPSSVTMEEGLTPRIRRVK